MRKNEKGEIKVFGTLTQACSTCKQLGITFDSVVYCRKNNNQRISLVIPIKECWELDENIFQPEKVYG